MLSDKQRIEFLEREVRDLKTIIATLRMRGGVYANLHQGIDCEGAVMPYSTFFASGMLANEPIQKIVMELGDNHAYAMDQTGARGPVGMAIGVSGYAISFVDALPAGVTVEVA